MQEVMADSAPEPVGPYPHARQVGDFLLLSGMGPRAAGQKDIPGVTLNIRDRLLIIVLKPKPASCSPI